MSQATQADILTGFTLSWAGECSAWECDELGHMNMRHYVYKIDEARRFLMITLGLAHAYSQGAVSSVRVRDFHIKYQSEARPGQPLRIASAVTHIGEGNAQLCHIMTHAGGRIAATVIETVEHIYLPEDTRFAWPKRVQTAIEQSFPTPFAVPLPAKARNVDAKTAHKGPPLSQLNKKGADILGAGVFGKNDIDITKCVTMGALFGRVTSTIAWFQDGWPELYDPKYKASGKSAALLEARAVIHRYPKRGDAYIYVPTITHADAYTRNFTHHLLDPVSGQSWTSMQASGCKFDLKARKLIKNSAKEIAALEKNMTPDLMA